MDTWRGLVLFLNFHRLRPDQKLGPWILRRGSLTNLQCPFAIWCYGNLPGMASCNPSLNEPPLFPNRISLFPAGQEEKRAKSGSLILKPIGPFHGPSTGLPSPSQTVPDTELFHPQLALCIYRIHTHIFNHTHIKSIWKKISENSKSKTWICCMLEAIYISFTFYLQLFT